MLLVYKVGDKKLSGWISIHRKIREHWIWQEKPFDKRSAWIDLLLMANFKDNQFLLGNELVEVERGSFITSEYKLMDKWGWSKTKVRNFLKLLENEKMIVKSSDKKKTTITIVNYNDYQVLETTKKPLKDYEKTTKELLKDYQETTKELQENPNNKDNKNNNDNKDNKDNKNSICMYGENLKNIVKLLEENIGVIPPILIDEISGYSETFKVEMLGEAIKIASNKKRRTVNYVLGILRNWKDNNILTLDDLEALRKEKQQNKQENNKSNSKKTKFHNFEQRTSNMSAEDLEEIARRKREHYFNKTKEE
jgi:DnaD/phage-associated family protein